MRWIDGLDECELVGSVDPTNLTSLIESRLINMPRSLERINETAVDCWSELHCFDDADGGKIESEIGNNNKKRRIVWARISRLAISISWQLLRCSRSPSHAERTCCESNERERERESIQSTVHCQWWLGWWLLWPTVHDRMQRRMLDLVGAGSHMYGSHEYGTSLVAAGGSGLLTSDLGR